MRASASPSPTVSVRKPAAAQFGGDGRARRIVRAQHGGADSRQGEYRFFRRAVGFPIAVIIQMIAPDVGANRRLDARAAEPPLRESVRGRLDYHARRAARAKSRR